MSAVSFATAVDFAAAEERVELLREARYSLAEFELHRRPEDAQRLLDALDELRRLIRREVPCYAGSPRS